MTKKLVEDFKSISIFNLNKWKYLEYGSINGTLTWSKGGNKTGSIQIESNISENNSYIRVYFIQTNRDSGETKSFDYKIYLVKTNCNYGKYRYWFICPYSGIRCGILYLQGNGIFACRKILNLAYENQNKSKQRRRFNKIFPKDYEAEKLYKTIKYKYRNGKPTRKYKKFLRLIKYNTPLDTLLMYEMNYLM